MNFLIREEKLISIKKKKGIDFSHWHCMLSVRLNEPFAF